MSRFLTPDLTIITCGGKKRASPAPAQYLYTGSFFKHQRRTAIRMQSKRWMILSAKHGLLNPEEVIEPYNIRWGQTGEVTQDKIAHQISTLNLNPQALIISLGGAEYRTRIRAALHPDIPLYAPSLRLDSSSMGYQMAQMKSLQIYGGYPSHWLPQTIIK